MTGEIEGGARVVITNVRPRLECGRYRVKAIEGDLLDVTADIVRDGPDLLQASLRYGSPSGEWADAPMSHLGNDGWMGRFRPETPGIWHYTVQAWTDHFATWRRDLGKRVDAGQTVDLELQEGALLLEKRLVLVPKEERRVIQAAIEVLRAPGKSDGWDAPRVTAAVDESVAAIMAGHPDRTEAATFEPVLGLNVERVRARFGAWYEFFPRSTGTSTEHGTFATAAEHLTAIAGMGFDVVYLPPIHPIGRTHRKGKNNALEAGPDDVGSPWAIGSEEGGHTDVDPKLGTIEDFDLFVERAGQEGLEVALDFAIQCSPDHPWATEHPEWFHHRPDGTIKYAENTPKKYQDIYPINFSTEDADGLWNELKRVLEFWISHGVEIFRVDNPHTKSFAFWEWVIDEIRAEHPNVIFLAEAFTRPKVMGMLAKLGFSQSYTYFTWRNTKYELVEYLNELVHTDMALYFRPNFFTNTQDILHEYLQHGGAPAFKIRLVLAALLSPSYGIYSGFELFERVPLHEGSEEYLHSEKYELRPRDLGGPDTLIPYIKLVNEVRRQLAAAARLTNLRWHDVDNEAVVAWSKTAPEEQSLLVVLNLNPFGREEATLHLDLDALGADVEQPFEVYDVVKDTTYTWSGHSQYVALDSPDEPAHIFLVKV
ncbi:MAG: alpha-1,4-glucan--maltose-1-phosphate maltosyltransferase [Actinobacteria bacterium]|nr:alpha-1,4-glucan--maltose-1-phosphate maltosyltransferase [Actinomycetota bacterium]